MADFSELREQALSAASNSNDLEKLHKAAEIMQSEVAAHKEELEAKALEETARWERTKFYVSTLAPLLSAGALLLALLFQTYQFKQTLDVQRDTAAAQKEIVVVQAKAAEDSQWREAVKTLTAGSNVITGYAASAMLKAFLADGSHKSEARSLALLLLGKMAEVDGFRDLYAALGAQPSKTNQPLVPEQDDDALYVAVELSRALRRTYDHVDAQIQADYPGENNLPDTRVLTVRVRPKGAPLGMERTEENPVFIRDQLDQEIGIISQDIAQKLSLRGNRQTALDLTGCTLWDADFSGVDISRARLGGAQLIHLELREANLSGVDIGSGLNLFRTAWWRAKSVSPSFLAYADKHFQYKQGVDYYGRAEMKEYRERLVLLRAAAN